MSKTTIHGPYVLAVVFGLLVGLVACSPAGPDVGAERVAAEQDDAVAQVRRVAEMTADELRMLDRERTAIILVGGILEQQWPYRG